MKKFVAISMVFVLIMTSSGISFAATQESTIRIDTVYSSIVGDTWVDIAYHNGQFYYFLDTQHYTITMDFRPTSGVLNIFHREKQNDFVTYGHMDINVSDIFTTHPISSGIIERKCVIDLFNQVSKYVISGIVTLSDYFCLEITHETVDSISNNVSPFGSVTNTRVVRELQARGHHLRSPFRIASVTQNGFTSDIYENTTFQNVNTRAIAIARNLTVSAVGVLISKPAAIVAILFALVDTGAGFVTAIATTAHEHRVNVRYIREGRIRGPGNTMVFQHRTLQYDVILGDLNETSTQRWVSVDTNFFNVNWIGTEAIRLWRQNMP